MRDEEFQALYGVKARQRLQQHAEHPDLPHPAEQPGVIDLRLLRNLLLLMVPVLLLWNTIFVYPLRMLVVFLHELSHGTMAILTGGSLLRIRLSLLEGGDCLTAGGNQFLVTSAGYLGSLLWGGMLLILATRTRLSKAITVALGLLVLLVALLFVRPLFSLGLLYTLLTGTGLLAAGLKLPDAFCRNLLKLVGLTSILYVPLDIVSDTILRSGIQSDARILAGMTGIPTVVHGVVWCLISVALGIWLLLAACRRPRGALQAESKQK